MSPEGRRHQTLIVMWSLPQGLCRPERIGVTVEHMRDLAAAGYVNQIPNPGVSIFQLSEKGREHAVISVRSQLTIMAVSRGGRVWPLAYFSEEDRALWVERMEALASAGYVEPAEGFQSAYQITDEGRREATR
jgi:hypothetical protein